MKGKILDFLKLTSYHRRRRKYNIGEHSYISHSTIVAKSARIGKYCSIADKVCIGVGSHPLNWLSTSPFQYYNKYIPQLGNMGISEDKLDKLDSKEPVIIGNDVYIGYGAFINPAVKIGDGAVIGAGAVVTKDVEPYSIVGGVPAKHIRYRFDEEIRNDLLTLKWWDLPESFIITLPFKDIKACIAKIKEYKLQKGLE